ncbi:MAG: cytochrome C oxidase subunit IV family protein, partial [Candidatus Rokuibacteriota bacterium]
MSRSSDTPREHDSSSAPHDPAAHAPVRTYVTVAAILCLVTALEFGVIYVRKLTPILVPLLLVMSAAKFALVVLFFMHLRYDARALSVIFAGALVIAVALAIALMTLTGQFLVFT